MPPPPEGTPGGADGAGGFPLLPHPGRLGPDHPHYAEILDAHDAAVDAGRPGYSDPESGLFVLTAAFLWSRGTCCDQGCRHCPYVARPSA
jgi:hypothetical protein